MSENISPADYGWTVWEDWCDNDSVADAEIGKMGWEIAILGGGAETLTFETAQGETFLRMTGAGGGTGDGSVLSLAADKVSLGQYGGECRFGFRIPDITGNTVTGNHFKFGFSDVITAGEPAVGLWMDVVAGVVEFDAASANGDVNVVAAGPTSLLTSGTTLIKGTTYDGIIRWSGNNGNADPGPSYASLTLNGHIVAETSAVLIDGAETMEALFIHNTTATDTLELDCFYYEAFSYRAK
ncbi:MAG: hypothetical protein DRI30_07005 [Chloroflexi bacterium]|nr:MAG: hypothetical protein DRI30_07005 [Chloroflexota bacterium]